MLTGLKSRWVSVAFLVILLAGRCGRLWAGLEIDEVLRAAADAGRPALIIGGSEYCGPCKALQRTLQEDASVRGLLQHCEHLELDVQSPEFVRFSERFPVGVQAIPMVYVILPSGSAMYARSGGLTADQLTQLLQAALQRSEDERAESEANARPPRPLEAALQRSQDERAESEANARPPRPLEAARECAREGELIDCLQLLQGWQQERGGVPAAWVAEFRALEDEVLAATLAWIRQLEELMQHADHMHGAAYRVAELYVELPGYAVVRAAAGDALQRCERQPETRIAVLQAKSLLVARYHEQKRIYHRALRSYLEVVRLDQSTPAGRFAHQRIELLRQHAGHGPVSPRQPQS